MKHERRVAEGKSEAPRRTKRPKVAARAFNGLVLDLSDGDEEAVATRRQEVDGASSSSSNGDSSEPEAAPTQPPKALVQTRIDDMFQSRIDN